MEAETFLESKREKKEGKNTSRHEGGSFYNFFYDAICPPFYAHEN